MINGAHVILYSANADADRAFLRDVIGLEHVDAGHGWLIFGLPPSEVAIHPGEDGDSVHELYLMCDDVGAFAADMTARQIACTPPVDRGWGILTEVTLPGGGKLGVYQPRHARPAIAAPPPAPARRPAQAKTSAKPKGTKPKGASTRGKTAGKKPPKRPSRSPKGAKPSRKKP